MIHIPSAKILGLAIIFLLLIVFSVLGFRAMKPQSSQRDIDAFWISIIIFLGVLALYIGIFISPLLAIAPVVPIFIFTRLFLATRKSSKK